MTADTCRESMPAYLLAELAEKQRETARLAAMELAATTTPDDDTELFDQPGGAW